MRANVAVILMVVCHKLRSHMLDQTKDSMKLEFRIKLTNVGRSRASEEFVIECKDRDCAESHALKAARKYLMSKDVELIENGEDNYIIIAGECRPVGHVNIEVNI